MFSEIVKLVPQIDRNSLNTMFKTLNERFSSVAKKFGQGMKGALKFGPLLAVAGAFLAKILNPLERAEELISKVINKGDDAVTNAEEFGTTPGKLLRLETIGAAKGLDPETLRMLLGKFQGALATETENAKDPQKAPGYLREFVGTTDMSDAFFSFIQALQAQEKSVQVVVQSQVFGERVRGKASEFFNSKDFAEILARTPDNAVLSNAATKTGALSDKKDLQTAIRNIEDFVNKSKLVKEGMVDDIDKSERLKNKADDETLKRYDALKSTSIAVQELTGKFDTFATNLINDTMPILVKALNELLAGIKILTPFVESIVEWTKGAFDGTLEALASMSLALETYWQEFKNSRFYKFFGGGK